MKIFLGVGSGFCFYGVLSGRGENGDRKVLVRMDKRELWGATGSEGIFVFRFFLVYLVGSFFFCFGGKFRSL